MLKKRINPRTKRKEYCLVSRDGTKVLEYYGKSKPTADQIERTESRVEHYKKKANEG